jgi:hypothetical protein
MQNFDSTPGFNIHIPVQSTLYELYEYFSACGGFREQQAETVKKIITNLDH